MLDAIGTEPLRQFPFGRDQQRLVREVRWLRAQRLEHLGLGRAVRDMIFTPNDVGHAKIDVVDDARQQIEPAAILAPDNRVAQELRIEPLFAANKVGEDDRRVMIEPEAPVRPDALGSGRAGGLALIDRRQPAAEQDLAAQIELLWRFIAGIDAPGVLQPLKLALIEVEPLRLADDQVGSEAHPLEVVTDRLVELGRRPLGVGIVDPEDEFAAILPREQIIVKRGADVADVQPPGRRRREAGDDTHRGILTDGPL